MTTNPGDDERGSLAPSEEWSEVVTAGAQAVAALKAAREVLADMRSGLVKVDHRELADLAAAVSGMVAEAESLRAAVVLEASSRGVIAQSDHPRAHRWVEQSCRDAGVPVVRLQARELGDIAITCAGHDVAALREAVTAGKIPMESAATVAKAYRKLRQEIEYPNWDALLNIIIDWAAEGASPKELKTLEDGLIGRYGREKELDEKHERTHAQHQQAHHVREGIHPKGQRDPQLGDPFHGGGPPVHVRVGAGCLGEEPDQTRERDEGHEVEAGASGALEDRGCTQGREPVDKQHGDHRTLPLEPRITHEYL